MSKSTIKSTLILILLLTPIIGFGYLFSQVKSLSKNPQKDPVIQAVEIKDNLQIINLTAKGGYFPNNVTAKAGIPSELNIKTQNTFDCSSALYIPALNFNEILKPNGITKIQIPAQESGKTITGSCSMRMYSFAITFE